MNRFHELAKTKGWHDEPLNVPEKLALIHSEISEALEDYRDGAMQLLYEMHDGKRAYLADPPPNLKPVGFASELADAVIRCYDLAGALGIDLDEAIERKHAFNQTRPHRHGGKKC